VQSLAHKLQRAAMIVPQGRLYICGIFATLRLADVAEHTARKVGGLRKRRRADSLPTGRNNQGGERWAKRDGPRSVPVTRWAKRNASWWKRYLERAPREYCFMPKVTYPGDLEADACGTGYGGFYTVGDVMYYFHGRWSAEEVASFESKDPLTLDINTLELSTQYFLLYLAADDLAGHVIMPMCDNHTSVILMESFKARSTHLAVLLEDYDQLAARHTMSVQMCHIPGVDNRVSDILSRDGVCPAFYAAVRSDFPSIKRVQDVSAGIKDIRSLARIMGSQ
jgi:hypothetical protein